MPGFFPRARDFELTRSRCSHSKSSTNWAISTDLHPSFPGIFPTSTSASLCCVEGHTVLTGSTSLVRFTLCSCVAHVALRHIQWLPESQGHSTAKRGFAVSSCGWRGKDPRGNCGSEAMGCLLLSQEFASRSVCNLFHTSPSSTRRLTFSLRTSLSVL